MATIDEIRRKVVGLDYNGVRRVLGNPSLITNYDAPAVPQNASKREIAAFKERWLDRIWVYADAVVSFNMAGTAREVTDDVDEYLPIPDPRRTLLSGDDDDDEDSEAAKKLPPLIGNARRNAWQSLPPIPDRPANAKNLGVVLFIHDVETKRVEFAKRSDADIWQAVHTISDLIEALRALVGSDKCIKGLMTSSHGGYNNHGGFRMGNDHNGDGKIGCREARDFVSRPAQAQKFGEIIKGAFCWCEDEGKGSSKSRKTSKKSKVKASKTSPPVNRGSPSEAPPEESVTQTPPETPEEICPPVGRHRCDFISIESCGSSGPGNKFIKRLQSATGLTVIGSDGTANVKGTDRKGAVWTAKDGRTQIDKDGNSSHSNAKKGTGVWRPF